MKNVKKLIGFITGFVDFLNLNGFAVSSDRMSRFISVCGNQDTDITNEDEIISAMCTTFCSSKKEVSLLPKLFKMYLQEKDNINEFSKSKSEIKALNGQKKDITNTMNKIMDNRDRSVNEIKKKISEEEKRIRAELKRQEAEKKPCPLSSADIKKINKVKDVISEFGDEVLSKGLLGGEINKFSPEEIKNTENKLVAAAKDALLKKDLGKLSAYKELQNILSKVNRNIVKSTNESEIEKDRETKVKRHLAPFREELNKINDEYEKQLNEQKKLQYQISDKLNRLNSELKKYSIDVTRPASADHREVFIPGGSVRTFSSVPEFAEKSMNKLSEKEKESLRQYLLDNLLRFKTRLTRNVATLERRDLDIQRTIQYACKTGGLPMQLQYLEKRPSKTNLMLVLDVSGSCSASSSMMLTFMYYLQNVFPRGCKAFAFVDSLYDITDFMQAKDPDRALKTVLDTIPVKGVYSNYAVPLLSLWKDHKKDITKDTMIIFMGDARNNRNPTGEDDLKNICRKARKAYWLNTESREKWDRMDSLASLYGKYANMYETTNPAELLWFIQEGIK